MPLYTYKHKRTGKVKVIMRTIAMRDMVPDHVRVPEFATGRMGLAENPHTQEFGIRQGLRDMEERYGAAEIQRQLGPGMSLKSVKKTWRN